MNLQIKKLHPEAVVPKYAHDTDAGMDFFAIERVECLPYDTARIRTGLALAIPDGYVGLVWDKSSVSFNQCLKTIGGVIDAGYRGEVVLGVFNFSDTVQVIEQGQKVAQLLIQKVEHPSIVEVEELDDTARGVGGWGSTGK